MSSRQAGTCWRGKMGWEDGGEWQLPLQLDTRPVVRWEIDV